MKFHRWMLRRGAYSNGDLDQGHHRNWRPTLWTYKTSEGRRRIGFAWLFCWRSKVVFHLLEIRYLRPFMEPWYDKRPDGSWVVAPDDPNYDLLGQGKKSPPPA